MTSKNRLAHAFLATALAATAGCAAYRVESNIEEKPAPAPATASSAQVLLSESGFPGRKYAEIGPIDVSVKKLTVFHADPTKEQANQALIEKARLLGADAVINVRYESGVGLTTWGYMDAKGTAVRFTK
ncbi:MAG: YbjQ family protein [Betaproteobacteria bacterium]|nr:YbjQ family protein [Betaproteobacteria bacterium]PWB58008.1 MAG: hypothetical protein C3F16_14340 [Betaproteobacteria bacterium]